MSPTLEDFVRKKYISDGYHGRSKYNLTEFEGKENVRDFHGEN